eukprot:3078369-Pyramimonas_sp.AAC.1
MHNSLKGGSECCCWTAHPSGRSVDPILCPYYRQTVQSERSHCHHERHPRPSALISACEPVRLVQRENIPALPVPDWR